MISLVTPEPKNRARGELRYHAGADLETTDFTLSLPTHNLTIDTPAMSIVPSDNQPPSPRPPRWAAKRHPRLWEFVNDGVLLRPFPGEGSLAKIIDANGVACQMLGYSLAELREKSVFDLFPVCGLKLIKAQEEQLSIEGRLICETRALRKDGREVPVEVSSRLFEWEGEQLVVTIVRDLSDRLSSLAALVESERFMRSTLDALSNRIAILDQNGAIMMVNHAWRKFWQESSPGAAQLSERANYLEICEAAIGKDRATAMAVAAGIRAILQGSQIEFHLDYPCHSATEQRWFACHVTRFAGEGPVRLVVSHENITGRINAEAEMPKMITERKRLEEQLRQSQKLEAIGRVAGGVAHDFNNILSAILMNLGFLQKYMPSRGEAQETILEIEGAAMRASNLTRQLLLFSQGQAPKPAPLNTRVLVENLLKMLSRLLGEQVIVDFASAAQDPWICADAGMIEQVIMNLCLNARDAMPAGGRLSLDLNFAELDDEQAAFQPGARPGAFVCLTVSDTGCGFDESVQARIFEPFFTTKEVGKGTGLGLATVYGIVQQHEGWIEVHSSLQQGSTFRVYLPAMAKPQMVPLALPPGDAISDGCETILLVEDEPAVRRPAALSLRKAGYTVLEAGNGSEALQVWRENLQRIDLLFTDLVLPEGLNGSDLATILRGDKLSLKVIISSGYGPDEAGTMSPSSNDFAFLAKPYRLDTLKKVLRQCLEMA